MALDTRGAFLAFGGWRPAGSPAAGAAVVLLSSVHRFSSIPLNLVISYAPFARLDDLALERTSRIGKVVEARRKAKIARWQAGRQLPHDLEACDWDVAAQVAAREDRTARTQLKSFIAIDRVTQDGQLELGARPALGRHAKRDGQRLPQMCVLTVRSASDAAIERLFDCTLLLVNITGARGAKTLALTNSVLERAPADLPAVVLSEGAAELSRFGESPLLQRALGAMPLSPCLPAPQFSVRRVGVARVQYEEQFRYAMPSDDLSPQEEEVAHLGVAAWRQRWRTVDPAIQTPLGEAFLKTLGELRRRSPWAADRFNLFQQLLRTSERDASASAAERLGALAATFSALQPATRRCLVVVGAEAEAKIVQDALKAANPSASPLIGTSRQLARHGIAAEAVVVSGYHGPATSDAMLRAAPSSIVWITDPIEAYQASAELHRQAAQLSRLGLREEADLLGVLDSTLRASTSGAFAATPGDHLSVFTWASRESGSRSVVTLVEDSAAVEQIDADANYLVVFLDGTRLRVSATRRFDVLRSQSPHPLTIPASELQEGDEVVLVRGSFQKTLSELLLEEMDRTELKEEASVRRTWVTIVQTAMDTYGLTVERVARSLRAKGIHAPPERVRSWLRDDKETTPLDWNRFLSFARVVGVGLDDEEIRYFFETIKRWRVRHRVRGRAVVRVLRQVRFGGLSVADMTRIETDWGLGIRDLIEGSRVEEVESVVPLQ